MIKFNLALERMGNRPEIHAEFLNTLSLLEYIGSRKIVKSQVDRDLTVELLGHITEEIRHAQVLKHLALKLSGGLLTTYQDEHLLCGPEGKAYFQTVDHAVEKILPQKDVGVNYLLTTFLVEERAAKVYPAYDAWLGKIGYPNKLLSIIRDEDKHLQEVSAQLKELNIKPESFITELRLIESDAFNSFMDAVLLRLR